MQTTTSTSSSISTTRRFRVSFGRFVPTLLILLLLGGVGYWGHHSGWQLPSFAAMTGEQDQAPDDWCDAHNVPNSICLLCKPEFLESLPKSVWCAKHGVRPCPICNPETVQLSEQPEVPETERDRVAHALEVRDRPANRKNCKTHLRPVQFASLEAAGEAGVDVEPVERRAIVETIDATGEITYDETRLARVSTRVPGSVRRVLKNVGDVVRRGDLLALVEAAEVGQTKAALLDALAQVDYDRQNVERLRPLADKQIISGSRYLEAKTALQQSRIRARRAQQALVNLGMPTTIDALIKMSAEDRAEYVQFLGIPADLRKQLAGTFVTNNMIPLVAPLDGVVIQRELVAGEVIDTRRVLFQLADTSRMWLTFNVAIEDSADLRLGQQVRFRPDGTRDEIRGELSWISTEVDKATRTVSVRADLDNQNSRLRNETFGLGQIVLREDAGAIVVPSEAVQSDGACSVVFIRDKDYFNESSPKLFHTRTVRTGATHDGLTEIIVGVWPGEVVVTAGSSVLRSQILKSKLGDGCTCGH